MFTREEIELWEEKNLSPFAMKSRFSKGRRHREKEHPYRSVYQRDRDRIVHSAAFRRLEYKTQVFIYHEGDYYRTRLTHTLEVSQISRTIAKALRLNEDLVEAISLAHDVGHTPFGHAVEETLNRLTEEEGGFNHNIQGLRVVDELERRYPNFRGLNLSWETREGIIRHNPKDNTKHFKEAREFYQYYQPTLETQLMDIADEIAYDSHDLDDGIKSGMIKENNLRKIALWKHIAKTIAKSYSNLDKKLKVYLAIRNLINLQVTDLIKSTTTKIKKMSIKNINDVRNCEERIVSFSPSLQGDKKELRNFLYETLYCHWRVLRMSNKAKRFIERLFTIYVNSPHILPPSFRKRVKKDKKNLKRIVCDFIAGMTDRYALEEYKKLFDPNEKI